MSPRVIVLIATYSRHALLRRALESLRDQGPALGGVVVVNNGGDAGTCAVARADWPWPVQLITPTENQGTAGGVAAGLRTLLAEPGATHAWVLDDDVVATPGVLTAMLTTMHATAADVVSPLLTDAKGIIRWFPGPLAQPAWNVIRRAVTPEDYLRQCGPAPQRWTWSIWASLLITRRAIESVGLPDARLWYQGTDIEYTLRLSAHFNCVLAPVAVCRHLRLAGSHTQRRTKELWSLQNGAYVALRLAHGRRALRHLPGNHFRYWQGQHYTFRAFLEQLGAFWRGAIRGCPVGLELHVRSLSYELTRP